MYTVYVLKSLKNKKSYVGMTADLDRRLAEHNTGKSCFSKRYKPWEIIYKEEFIDLNDALAREKFFKASSGRRFLKKIFSDLADN